MARWTDIADWIGLPAENFGDGDYRELERADAMYEVRGVVLHIEQGSDAGSTAWMKNPASNVSSHFLSRKAQVRGSQMVDTADRAWTQADGNGHWLSIENEGFSGEQLTAQQVEFCAQVLAKAHLVYGVPLQATDDPNGYGLGWHGMGGADWGGHYDCPGEPIKAQRGAIVARAHDIVYPPTLEDNDMGASTPPIDIPATGRGSFNIPPVQRGDADPRPAWLNISNSIDGGQQYGLRIAAFTDAGPYAPSGDGSYNQYLDHGKRYSYALLPGTYLLEISRVPVGDSTPYAGHLTWCLERGAVGA